MCGFRAQRFSLLAGKRKKKEGKIDQLVVFVPSSCRLHTLLSLVGESARLGEMRRQECPGRVAFAGYGSNRRLCPLGN
jgi:hypothetical protein